MKKVSAFLFLFLFTGFNVIAQVGINADGSDPDQSAMLDVKSTSMGILFPRLSNADRNVIPSPVTGLLIYNISTNLLNYFNGSQWVQISTSVTTVTTGSVHPGGGVSINISPNSLPDGSAMLDVNNPSRGILIPRTIPDSIAIPARGLILYNVATNRINYFNGNAWKELCASSTGVPGGAGSQNPIGVTINSDGSPIHPSAILDVSANNKGVLIPRLTENQRNALLPAYGLAIYNLNSDAIEFYNGTSWCKLLVVGSLPVPTPGVHVPLPTQITWNWNTVSGATGYKWGTTNVYASATDMGTSLIKTETGLTPGTAYTRYIWAYNDCGVSVAMSLTQSTLAWTCGTSITVNHVAGTIAPVTKTIIYGTVIDIPGEPSKCWITSNLGSDHQANSVNDATEASAGWYWQYNRKQGYRHDGLTVTPSWTITGINEPSAWITANDPCSIELGITWHIPTYTEWYNVDNAGGWGNWNGPWGSGLKLHSAGSLSDATGSLVSRGVNGNYWSSDYPSVTNGWSLTFSSGGSGMNYYGVRASGYSIRCITCSPTLISPTSGSHTPSATQITWNWNTVSDATGYKWSTTNSYADAIDMGMVLTKTETGLTCNTAYTRYAWAYTACANSTPVTLTQSTLSPPAAPTAGTQVPLPTQITWNWNTVAWGTSYKWNTTNSYADAIDMGTAVTKTETGLTCNTAYTRYAWAYNACGNSTPVTLTQSTLLNPPAAPTAGTHVPLSTQITWNWNAVASATGYKWNTVNNYAGATDMGTAITNTETGLACSTAYTRYAWAYNACGTSTPVTLNQTTSTCPGAPCTGTPTVSYGGQTYNTVQIGPQCWFKENLNIGTRINGALEQTNNSIIEKYCYNDLESNCNIYGGLYQWTEMMQYATTAGVQGICPTGWHIPTEGDWCTVTQFLDPTVNCGVSGISGTNAGGKMKSTGTIQAGTGLWNTPNYGATNESGFSAVPAGQRYSNGSSVYLDLGNSGYWWSSSEYDIYSAWGRNLHYGYSNVYRISGALFHGFSVRCVRNF
ncbi:MAG: hypothetical protein NT040_15750 [Bacteroidetes bacterium]|nr:hypothetical protein [Bacteroidota bacterium]